MAGPVPWRPLGALAVLALLAGGLVWWAPVHDVTLLLGDVHGHGDPAAPAPQVSRPLLPFGPDAGSQPVGGVAPTSPGETAPPLPGPDPASPYDGPSTMRAVFDACPARGSPESFPCYTEKLKALLSARGSVAAFRVLAEMAAFDTAVNAKSHPIAHDLGRHALAVYGSIQDAMATCSYEVFAGCFHGALQAHFEGLPGAVGEGDVRGLCPSDNLFRQYTCLHGVGHGLFLATKHDLNRSLAVCDALETGWAQGSCHGGAFMENVVGYFDQRAGHSHHAPDAAPYTVDPSDPYKPCNIVAPAYRTTCWLMQTSLILYYNGGDFRDGARKCADAPAPHPDTCFRSLGRDAAAYTNRDAPQVVERCAYSPTASGRAMCIRGFAAESILNYATPEAGLRQCKLVPEVDKGPCYEETGVQGITMWSMDRMRELCAQAERGHEGACRRGAGIYL